MNFPSNSVVGPVRTGAGRVAAVSLATMVLGSVVAGAGAATGATVCVPTTESPVLTVDPAPVSAGSTLRVEGTGWCHPTDGGSLVALKIDEGAYSRLDASLHPNRTIWALVEASASDGTFTVDLQLPDGTLATSTPQFPAGTHNLRALSGSLKAGDVPRTVESSEFVVGAHQPRGIPEPVALEGLTARSRNGVAATLGKKQLDVLVPGGEEGDWVFLTLLAPDGSPRHVWGDSWWRLDRGGRITVPTADVAVQGAHRLVVQDGNIGKVGKVRGWVKVLFPTTKSVPGRKKDDQEPDGTSGTAKKAPSGPVSTPSPVTSPVPVPVRLQTSLPVLPPTAGQVLPTTLGRPVRTFTSLPQDKVLAARVDGDEFVVRTEREETDLFVHVYDTSSSVAGGWSRSDAKGRVRLDLRDLPDGEYRVSLTDVDEKLVGWAAIDLAPGADDPAADRGTELAPEVKAAATPSGPDRLSPADGWLAGIGAALLMGVGLGRLARKEGTR